MGKAASKQPTFETMAEGHKLDRESEGVTAELLDYDPRLWKGEDTGEDEEDAGSGVQEKVELTAPETGKVMRITVRGSAVFFLTPDRRIILQRWD